MIEICPESDFPDGGARTVTVIESVKGSVSAGFGAPRDISVFREGERFYAMDDACTHVGASHSKSMVKDGVIECWLHKGQFSLESGEPVRYPARKPARVYKVAVKDGVVVLFLGEDIHDVLRYDADQPQ